MRSLKDIGLFVVVIFIRYIDYYWLKVGAFNYYYSIFDYLISTTLTVFDNVLYTPLTGSILLILK